MNVVFRCDASFLIGTGHVSRCLTLAAALKRKGATCEFVCRNLSGNLVKKIEGEGFRVILLDSLNCSTSQVHSESMSLTHSDWLGCTWFADAQQTKGALQGTEVDWLIVDHYALDYLWESELRQSTKRIMVIDDLGDRCHECDLLLDQNPFTTPSGKYDGIVPVGCVQLLGPSYAMLRPVYAEMRERNPPKANRVPRILIFFGGCDHSKIIKKTLLAIKANKEFQVDIDVVLNSDSAIGDEFLDEVGDCSRISFYKDLPDLANLMIKADLAIGAAGTTSWERCCLGLPALVVTVAENQRTIASTLHELGIVKWIGHHDSVEESELVSEIGKVLKLDDLSDWSQRCAAFIDGHGVDRVASVILLGNNTKLKIRLARLDDEDMLLEWANDSAVRENSFSKKQIDSNTHKIWFQSRLRRIDNCKIFIVESETDFPIGQVRFELIHDRWEIDFSIALFARGRGLGKRVLVEAMQALSKDHPSAKFIARVKNENINSQKVFEELGYIKRLGDEHLEYYTK